MMKAVASRDRGEMKKAIRRVVVSLFLHMDTESRSMAEASGKALLVSAKFLGWRKLKRAIKKRKSWVIGETLLKQDRSRVEDYVRFSLPYLQDSRASVRAEAIRFIGTAVQHLGRNPPEETLEVLWNVVKPFDKDPDASVRSQAGETLHILQTATELQRQRWSLRRLCFWR
ncbi:maestro heat-like repeat-containing protein family member 7 [Heliangelus exortis]|uniref:maestro heat-like repeat-containing protein family member 7 n=1 Tax=Heliangelus exortis TaxID=472823 RepID=UPI003A91D117